MKPDIIDELFAKYYNEMLLYTISLCKNKTVAEDIVSNAFYKALISADDEIKNFRAWLYTVCRNEFISYCRKNSKVSGDEISEDTADDMESVVDKIIRHEEYKAMYMALDMLTSEQREIITLFYFSEMKIADISAITGKSESSIKVTLYRGREKLKELMEKS